MLHPTLERALDTPTADVPRQVPLAVLDRATNIVQVLSALAAAPMDEVQRAAFERALCTEFWRRRGTLFPAHLWRVLAASLDPADVAALRLQVSRVADAFNAQGLDDAVAYHAELRLVTYAGAGEQRAAATIAQEWTYDYLLAQRALAEDVHAVQAMHAFGEIGAALAAVSAPWPPHYNEIRERLAGGVPIPLDDPYHRSPVRAAARWRHGWARRAPTLTALVAFAAAHDRQARDSAPMPAYQPFAASAPVPAPLDPAMPRRDDLDDDLI